MCLVSVCLGSEPWPGVEHAEIVLNSLEAVLRVAVAGWHAAACSSSSVESLNVDSRAVNRSPDGRSTVTYVAQWTGSADGDGSVGSDRVGGSTAACRGAFELYRSPHGRGGS
jgi:hypothetical protein